MSKKEELLYFLNSLKEPLSFKNPEDLKNKIETNKEFRIKIQKLVYISKLFGWENNYHFNLHFLIRSFHLDTSH